MKNMKNDDKKKNMKNMKILKDQIIFQKDFSKKMERRFRKRHILINIHKNMRKLIGSKKLYFHLLKKLKNMLN